MKKVLGAMIGMFVSVVLLGGVWTLIFRPLIGVSVVELSFIYPIYAGLIILSGIVVGCSVAIHDEIEKLRKEIKNQNIQDTQKNMHTSDSKDYIDKES